MSNNTEFLLDLFRGIFRVCLVMTILFLLLTVALFFLLKIRDVRAELSGKARAAAIRRMRTGQAAAPGIGRGLSGSLTDTLTSGGLSASGGTMLTDRLKEGAPAPGGGLKPSGGLGGRSAGLGRPPAPAAGFVLQKDIMVIHTDETMDLKD